MAEDQQRLSTTMSSQGLWSSSESSVFMKGPQHNSNVHLSFLQKRITSWQNSIKIHGSWVCSIRRQPYSPNSQAGLAVWKVQVTLGTFRHERDLHGHSYSPGPRPLAAGGPLYPHAYPSGLPNSPPAPPTPHHPAPSTGHYWLKSSSSYVPG